jgi:hypothetical protein
LLLHGDLSFGVYQRWQYKRDGREVN